MSQYKSEVDVKSIGQYTGLNDVKGKEIYEGDIVKCKYYDFDGNVSKYIGKVFYRKDNCMFLLTNGKSTDYEWWDEEKEVIGNYYENPELFHEND